MSSILGPYSLPVEILTLIDHQKTIKIAINTVSSISSSTGQASCLYKIAF